MHHYDGSMDDKEVIVQIDEKGNPMGNNPANPNRGRGARGAAPAAPAGRQ